MRSLKVLFLLLALSVSVNCEVKKTPHPHGVPDTFIYFPEGKPIIVDRNALKSLETLGDYKVAVYSILGALRMGKSYLMNYCLRYLYANYKSVNFMSNPLNAKSNWMGGAADALTGFPWRSGKKSETAGIVIWSDIFLYENDDEKIAIVLMDTQGIFDPRKSNQDTMNTFVLNSLFSSFLIFYEDTQIKENQLEFMKVNIEYAKMIANENKNAHASASERPFQNLLFLIRNWPNADEFSFGLVGGNEYVEHIFKFDGIKSSVDTRSNLKAAYENINGFLLPYPGEVVATNRNYNGRWSDMDPSYKEILMNFIDWVFRPKNLVKKKFFGEHLNGKEYFSFLVNFCEAFKTQEHPDISSIYKMTIDNQMSIAVGHSLEYYKDTMTRAETSFSLDADYEKTITDTHTSAKEKAISMFNAKKKIGPEKVLLDTLVKLRSAIDNEFDSWKSRNEKVLRMISMLRSQLDEEVKKAEKKMANIQTTCDNNMQMLKDQIKSITASKDALQKQVEENAKRHDRELNDLKKKLDDSTKTCETRISTNSADFNKQITNLKAEHTKEIKKIESDCKAREDAKTKTIAELEKKMKQQKVLFTIDLTLIQEEKKKLEREAKDRERDIKSGYDKQIEKLNGMLEELEQTKVTAIKEANKQITSMRNQLGNCEQQNREYSVKLLEAGKKCAADILAEQSSCRQKV